MKNKVTILDLAKESEISKSTISRYLQGNNISLDKQAKIEKAIADLGYIKNNFASFLRTNKSNILGVLIPDLDNPFFVKIIKRMEILSQEVGKTLIIKTTKSMANIELEAIHFIRGFLVEAIFLCRSELTDDILNSLNTDTPFISLDKRFKTINSIVSNNRNGGYILTEHLFQNVSGNVMFFSRVKDSTSVIERSDGYKAYCREHNKQILEYKYMNDQDVDYDNLLEYIKKNNVEGIISRNDNDAVRILSFLNEMTFKGLIYRLKVCGFDNISLSRRIVPKLTTIDQKIEDMCDTAFDILMNYNELDKPKIFVQQGELIIRESSINTKMK